LLYGERAKAHDPHKWVVVGEEQSREIYSCMVRKDDPQFLALVNGALGDLYSSGRSTASTSAGSNSRFRRKA
jgi:glutamate/aspartate transport system substrate-binding protein